MIAQILAEKARQTYQNILTKQVANTLKTQVQFYFSDANLFSDHKFIKAINKNKWIDIAYILRCSKVKQILSKYNFSYRTQKRIITFVLKDSTLLKIHHMKIKRKKPFKKNIKKFLYLQLQQQQMTQNVLNFVKESMSKNFNFTYKSKKNWLIIVQSQTKKVKYEIDIEQQQNKEGMQNQQITKIEQLQKHLNEKVNQFRIKRIENGHEWQKYEQKFIQLLKKRQNMRKKLKQKDSI